jgi:hypothetical protein
MCLGKRYSLNENKKKKNAYPCQKRKDYLFNKMGPQLLTIYIKKQEIFITITWEEVKATIRLQSFWPIRYYINEI